MFYKKSIKWPIGVGAAVALATLGLTLPSKIYNTKVGAYTREKEMDVYTKSNNAERELYTQLAEKAKNSSPEERETLKEQYLKIQIAKNQVPDFVPQKRNKAK